MDDLVSIPPYGQIEVPLKIAHDFNLKPEPVKLTATLNDQVVSQDITFLPFYQFYLTQIGVVGLVLGGSAILLIYVRRRNRPRSA